ncbi:MAG: type III pantothenate kinase [Mariprofundaceae bacterium]|nr:type III pantothenate kinase [Mariprofundaceae bacterium]
MAETPALLLVDIGNTCMVFGLYHGDVLTAHWQLSSEGNMTSDELALKLCGLTTKHARDEIRGILAASVVPHLDDVLKEACSKVFGATPAFVGTSEVKTGMAVDYKNPREVGADRIANAVAAREQFGSPVIVMDCGTATTFDVVSPEGHYAGGLILPGMELALAALSGRAARLPEVSFGKTDTLIGRDTASSMQTGSYWGMVEALSGIIRRLHTLTSYEDAPVIATGGQSATIIEDISGITEHRPRLTLEGLLLLAKRHFA